MTRSIKDDKLLTVLHKTFRDRLAEVFDQAQHASSAPASMDGTKTSVGQAPMDETAADFVAGMDDWERECESALLPTCFRAADVVLQYML